MTNYTEIVAVSEYKNFYDDIEGLVIVSPKNIYPPHDTSTTRYILEVLPDVTDLDFLEIGGGTGTISLAAKKRGAKNVVVTDISEKACTVMECNSILNNLNIDIRNGNLFEPIRQHEKFDLVIFNLPLMDKPVEDESEIATCDPEGLLQRLFLHKLPEVLRKNGLAIFTHGTISSPIPEDHGGIIKKISEKHRGSDELVWVMEWSRRE